MYTIPEVRFIKLTRAISQLTTSSLNDPHVSKNFMRALDPPE